MACLRVIIRRQDGGSYAEANPFRIACEIRAKIGDVQSAKPTASGALLVEVFSNEQAQELGKTQEFLGESVTTSQGDQDTVEATAYAPSLASVPDEELLAELRPQGVVGITRLRPRDGKANPRVRLTITGKTVPASIRAGYQDIELQLWISSPLMCRNCSKYGHTAKRCRSQVPRCLRCSGGHPTPDCRTEDRLCPQCGGNHAAWERSCPTLQEHFNREKRRYSQRDSLPDAGGNLRPRQRHPEATTQTEPNKNIEATTQTEPSKKKTAKVQTRPPISWAVSTQTKRTSTRQASSQASETGSEAASSRQSTPQSPCPTLSPVRTRHQRAQETREAANYPRPPHQSQWGRKAANFVDSQDEEEIPARALDQ